MADRIFNDLSLLHPKFSGIASRLAQSLNVGYKTGETKTYYKVFETFRDPWRQKDLLAKGTTKAGPYQSAHQLGLAIDFVPYIDATQALKIADILGERVLPGWSWWSGHDWDYLTKKAKALGLSTIEWDRPHVQHPRAAELLLRLKNI